MALYITRGPQRIDLEHPDTATNVIRLLEGATGLGIPNANIQWAEGAGDGATYRGARVLPRDIDLPLMVEATSREWLQWLINDLASVFDPYRDFAGPTHLNHRAANGEVWRLEVVRVGGGVLTHDRAAIQTYEDGESWARLVIQLRAGDPYWTRTTPETASTTSAGWLNIPMAGDAKVYPVWRIEGPLTAVKIGGGLSWSGQLAAGEWIDIDTARGTVRDNEGRNRFGELGPLPRFRAFSPDSNYRVEITGKSGAGRITATWHPRRWSIL